MVYPEASPVVSQPLESSPMASKTQQPSHDPPFQAPVTLKHDESVKHVNAKPCRSVSRKHRRQAVVELSNYEIANTQAKTMAKRRDEHPAQIVGPSYEETTIALKPSVAEDNEERKRLYRTVKKQRESDGKRMIQRLNARKTLY